MDTHFEEQRVHPLLAQIYPRISNNHYIDPSLPRCFGYCEGFKKNDAPSEIYAAVDSVTNYLAFSMQSRSQRREKHGVYSEFYFPIVVLDGRLFEASIEGSNIDLQERPHVQLRTWGSHHDLTVIDIVTKNQFQSFFDNLEQTHNEFVAAIASLRFSKEFRATAMARKPDLGFHGGGVVAMAIHDMKERKKKAL